MTGKLSALLHGLVVALILLLIASSAHGQTTADMRQWGQLITKTMPPSVKKGGTLKQLQYAFAQYCDALHKEGVTNNSTITSRLKNLIKERSATKWTCGDHTNLLNALFSGMGIPEKNRVYLMADAQQRIPSPNSDHGALGVFVGGKVYVFDAWQVARVTGSFKLVGNPLTARWNGMPAEMWELNMISQMYSRFKVNDGDWFNKLNEAIQEYGESQKLIAPQKRKPTGYSIRNEDEDSGPRWKLTGVNTPEIPEGPKGSDPKRFFRTFAKGEENYLGVTSSWNDMGYSEHHCSAILTWKFSRSVKNLRPGEKFTVDLTIELRGEMDQSSFGVEWHLPGFLPGVTHRSGMAQYSNTVYGAKFKKTFEDIPIVVPEKSKFPDGKVVMRFIAYARGNGAMEYVYEWVNK